MSDNVDLSLIATQQARVMEELREQRIRLDRIETYLGLLDQRHEATESCLAEMVETMKAVVKLRTG
jgi:hypothetical protein